MNATAALQRAIAALILAASAVLPASLAWGDPLPGRDVLKFTQRPMDGLSAERALLNQSTPINAADAKMNPHQ